MSGRYRDTLDYERGARVVVEFMTDRHDVVDYAVVLTIDDEGSEASTTATPSCSSPPTGASGSSPPGRSP